MGLGEDVVDKVNALRCGQEWAVLGVLVEVPDERVEAEAFIRAAASSISHRGKSQVGDKTILDAMVPAVDSLARSIEANPEVASDSALAAAALDSAIADAAEAVVATRDLQSQRGRASWLQDRSIGLQDPGATAFLRALEAWRDASTGERGPRAAVVENL